MQYGFRLPSALDNRPLRLEGVRGAHAPVRVRVGHAGRLRAGSTPITWSSRWCGRPGWSIRSSRNVRRTQVDDLLGEIHKRRRRCRERVLVTTLTKRMAEDLTDFLSSTECQVRYLPDIDTVERVEIIRDLRLGVFDVLVGINLLRGAWISPSVAGGHLDADKEAPAIRAQPDTDDRPGRPQPEWPGHSLRRPHNRLDAACHRRTERRRAKQIQHNTDHGITARGVQQRPCAN